MRWFRFAVLILFVAVLQAGMLANLSIKPDLLMVLLVFFAIYCDTTEAIITSFTIGFAADIISYPIPMGPQMISFGLFGTLLAYLHRYVAIRKMPYQSLTIFLTAILVGSLAYGFTFIRAYFTAPLRDMLAASNIYTGLFWPALCSGIVGPFLFLPSAWWMRIKIHRFSRR